MTFPSIRSLKTGSLLLAALAAAALPAFAGETTVTASSKDKNPVVEKPKTEPRFYVDLMAGGEFDSGPTDFIGDGRANLGGKQHHRPPFPALRSMRAPAPRLFPAPSSRISRRVISPRRTTPPFSTAGSNSATKCSLT